MTLHDFEELTAYWAEHPVHILVAAYLGLTKQKRLRRPSGTSGAATAWSDSQAGLDVDSILAELGPGFASGNLHTGLGPVVLDFAELRRKAMTAAD
jgi:hypothetical protein